VLDDIDLSGIQDEAARKLIERLLNLVEELSADLRASQIEVQRLRDENNRLKGEQGKPTIKPNVKPSSDHSSEQERHQPKAWVKHSKRDQITIDRSQEVVVDPASLPADAVFKGYDEVVVQDVMIRTDNVLFRKEKWYSPSKKQSYLAALPAGYQGEFGPGIRALALVFYFGSQMTESKIAEWFAHVGISISAGQLSNLLIKHQKVFEVEQEAAYIAGLESSPWQHIDDTATRVNGQNYHCQVITNPLHTTFVTTENKDRLTILDVLRNGAPRTFCLNDEAFAHLEWIPVAAVTRQKLTRLPRDQTVDQPTMEAWIERVLPKVGVQTRKHILDATAAAAYHLETDKPIVRALVCDGALQFTWLTADLAACWVHEGRHYKKLEPAVARHRQRLNAFLKKFWDYYRELLDYRENPTPEEQHRLSKAFDELFYPNTSYADLDERIGKTWFKKAQLLLVLEHPELPLHNNPAELGARQRVRKRDISYGPRTADGVKAWDTFMSLAATTKQLGISFYRYIYDRVAETNQLPKLANIIHERAAELQLGSSWTTR
jgi:hypothetical protein